MDILKAIESLILGNWDNIIVVLLFVLFCLFIYFKLGKEDFIRRLLLDLVVKAEKEYSSGTGLIKYNHVVNEFYNIMPSIMKIFITRKMLDVYIEEAVDQLKHILSDGTDLQGI